jgi:pyrroloquinoline quinone (PQQ) biosynthesis protein C
MGHELWALADLKALGVDEATVYASRPVPACSSMIAFEYYTAGRQNPIGLFGWLYVLESMGDDLGGPIASALQHVIGADAAGVKFLAGHGVADQEHTADLTRVISQYITDPEDVAEVNYVADVVADLYVRMFQQIAGTAH